MPTSTPGQYEGVIDSFPDDRAPAAQSRESSPDELPDYLTRYYAWAYVWPVSVWFFDHQPIINAILFGNYARIMEHTLRLLDAPNTGSTLQVAAVYGKLTPTIARDIDDLHLLDAAQIQLDAAQRKVKSSGRSVTTVRMHAEAMNYADDRFDTALMFLLLHELPPGPRRESLRETLRVTRRGGHLVIAEYGELGQRHLFHRLPPMRWLLTTVEPFLQPFWTESLSETLQECANASNKSVELEEQVDVFGGFYRVMRYRIV